MAAVDSTQARESNVTQLPTPKNPNWQMDEQRTAADLGSVFRMKIAETSQIGGAGQNFIYFHRHASAAFNPSSIFFPLHQLQNTKTYRLVFLLMGSQPLISQTHFVPNHHSRASIMATCCPACTQSRSQVGTAQGQVPFVSVYTILCLVSKASPSRIRLHTSFLC